MERKTVVSTIASSDERWDVKSVYTGSSAASSPLIGLMDHMGFGNLGDAAIHESFIQNIKKRLPHARLIAFSENPEDTSKRHNLLSYPIAWKYPGCWQPPDVLGGSDPGRVSRIKSLLRKRCSALYRMAKASRNVIRRIQHLKRTYRLIRSLNLLVVAGGGQLCELWGGAWSHPYNVFTFCVLAKIAGTPVVIFGVGADLLKHPLSKFFARWAVRLADYTSFRSVESQVRVRELGVTKTTYVCPDPAYALDLRQYLAGARALNLRESGVSQLVAAGRGMDASGVVSAETSRALIKVGLNPIGFCDPRIWPRKDEAAYLGYLEKTAQFGSWLLAHGYRLELFTTDIVVDRYALQDLNQIFSSRGSTLSWRGVTNDHASELGDVFEQMADFDFIITTKFHGVVFSHLLGKPAIALSYLPKINDLMQAFGQSRYCLNVDDFETDTLIERFDSMVREADDIASLVRANAARYAGDLEAAFDRLADYGILREPRARASQQASESGDVSSLSKNIRSGQ